MKTSIGACNYFLKKLRHTRGAAHYARNRLSLVLLRRRGVVFKVEAEAKAPGTENASQLAAGAAGKVTSPFLTPTAKSSILSSLPRT